MRRRPLVPAARSVAAPRGFALVEVLVVGVLVAILVGVLVLAVGQLTTGPRHNACRAEAQRFRAAVARYHDVEGRWPADGTPLRSVQAVAATLAQGDYGRVSLAHLDGSQRDPATSRRGWVYDFGTHLPVVTGCG